MARVIDVPEAVVKLDDGNEFSLSQFLSLALDMYEPLGKGTKAIRQAVKIHAILEGMNGTKTVKFEDADFEVVKAAVEAGKWVPRLARKSISYFDAIEKAQEVKV